ncbi:MAG: pilus assembly protein [Proteobacteria bacterium]|nr:pilus assembly protein [Pseudomonadota bacterium]
MPLCVVTPTLPPRRRSSEQRGRHEEGQAVVESLLVLPLLVFLVLGVIQLVMMQHARLMTEYAAFNAARSGIVWNADRLIMENAAIISLLPTNERLREKTGLGDPFQLMRRIIQRALIYQVHRKISAAVGVIRDGVAGIIEPLGKGGGLTGKVMNSAKAQLALGANAVLNQAQVSAELAASGAIAQALGSSDDRLVRVDIFSPQLGAAQQGTHALPSLSMDTLLAGVQQIRDPRELTNAVGSLVTGGLQQMVGTLTGDFGAAHEIDFDTEEPGQAPRTRLSVRVRYMYMLRVPFANWVIHSAWLAARGGQQLFGAVWNPQEREGETGFRSVARLNSQRRDYAALLRGVVQGRDLAAAIRLSRFGVYMWPIYASYTMRMQSNPYRQSLELN